MNQIYVVCASPSLDTAGTVGCPRQAFQDYPSAFAYAQSIFSNNFSMFTQAKDLIFMIPYTATPIITTPTGTVASTVGTVAADVVAAVVPKV